jgi:hypothetical protein
MWVDTNCINKSSSAELSEAINSMFAWYRNSEVCYVYLADVEDPDNVAGGLDEDFDNVSRELGDDSDESEELDWVDYLGRRNPVKDIKNVRFTKSLRKSRWFTRGWTLQELLAPRYICLFTQAWNRYPWNLKIIVTATTSTLVSPK